MKEAIGGTWIFQIVIFFILVFTGFMCLSINRSKAFNVKDQIIQTIQSYNGINLDKGLSEEVDAFYDIVEYIKGTSYRNTGVYPKDEKVGDKTVSYACFNREGKPVTNNPTFCIARINTSEEVCSSSKLCELPEMVYYRVMVFYQLDLPIFHEWFNFQVVGDTKTLYRGAE